MNPNTPIIKPPCSEWNIWMGSEIEGNSDIGQKTLFIRSIPLDNVTPFRDYSFLTRGGTITRVWFCKEFIDWAVLERIASFFEKVCVEAEPPRYAAIPRRIRERATIYLKVSLGGHLNLKKGDYVCVGPPFSDEAFCIGEGEKVIPELYLNDTKIL